MHSKWKIKLGSFNCCVSSKFSLGAGFFRMASFVEVAAMILKFEGRVISGTVDSANPIRIGRFLESK
jgi:hypothetical protein